MYCNNFLYSSIFPPSMVNPALKCIWLRSMPSFLRIRLVISIRGYKHIVKQNMDSVMANLKHPDCLIAWAIVSPLSIFLPIAWHWDQIQCLKHIPDLTVRILYLICVLHFRAIFCFRKVAFTLISHVTSCNKINLYTIYPLLTTRCESAK